MALTEVRIAFISKDFWLPLGHTAPDCRHSANWRIDRDGGVGYLFEATENHAC